MARRTNINDVYIGEDWYIPFFFKAPFNIGGMALAFWLYESEESETPEFVRTVGDGIVVVSASLGTGYTFVPRDTTNELERRVYWWEFGRTDLNNVKLYGFGELSLLYDIET